MPDGNFLDRFTCHSALQPGVFRVWCAGRHAVLPLYAFPKCCVPTCCPYMLYLRAHKLCVLAIVYR